MKFQFALLASLLAAAPALAQENPRASLDHGATSAPADARRTGDLNANGERLICRSISSSSTSRMAARRVCRTAAEWRAAQRAESNN
jgi:hypothetical protein